MFSAYFNEQGPAGCVLPKVTLFSLPFPRDFYTHFKASIRWTEVWPEFYAAFRSAEAEVYWIDFCCNLLLLAQLYELGIYFFLRSGGYSGIS